ncbi:MAG TPA: sulfate/molybdate ABC transporter ATP-binding protein [Microvirga sp.]|nr:sulfate/molybdate ABC transporter ATP-binding protein [Microvirga sp.]
MDITVVDLEKQFGDTAALRGVNLEIRAGELMALLGPSGSGKTTLLRVIAGLEIPNSGRVLFGDIDATRIPVQQRQVGFVFQHYALFKHLNVFDNIAYGLRARSRRRRPSETDIRRRVLALLDLVQLEGLNSRFPAQLSGGQRQRVALARALAVEPRVLLLDEPFGALDAKVRKDLRRWLRNIHERTGQTTIFVTHDQDEALELADRVTILNDGRVEQVGTPGEVYDHPASPFVMDFVGETAQIPVTIQDGQAWFGGQQTGFMAEGERDGAATLYVRPSDLELASAGLTATVTSTRRRGEGSRTQVVLGEQELVLEVDTAVPADMKRGDAVHVVVRGGRLFRCP